MRPPLILLVEVAITVVHSTKKQWMRKRGGKIRHTYNVGMCWPPSEGSKFHDRNKPAQVLNFITKIFSMQQSGQIEQFCSCIHLCPETVLQCLLGFLQLFVVLQHVQVSQHTHYSWHSMNLNQTTQGMKRVQWISTQMFHTSVDILTAYQQCIYFVCFAEKIKQT